MGKHFRKENGRWVVQMSSPLFWVVCIGPLSLLFLLGTALWVLLR